MHCFSKAWGVAQSSRSIDIAAHPQHHSGESANHPSAPFELTSINGGFGSIACFDNLCDLFS
jgi:hypothetical protein